jgi:hypothetical protein
MDYSSFLFYFKVLLNGFRPSGVFNSSISQQLKNTQMCKISVYPPYDPILERMDILNVFLFLAVALPLHEL